MPEKESWHLRKELSIGTIVSLLVLCSGALYGYGQLRSDVESLAETKVDAAQVIRIEERQVQLKDDVEQIKRKVEVLPEIKAELRNLVRELERQRQHQDRERNGG